MEKNIGILGAGSWGATLATLLSEKGHRVTLWEFDPEKAKELAMWRSLNFFPHLTIPKDVTVTSDLLPAVEGKDFIIFVVPSHTFRGVARSVKATGADMANTVFVSATKGLENKTLCRMSEIIAAEIPAGAGRIVALSGPSHAEEVSQKIPTTVAAASENADAARACQEEFITPFFRIYTNSDITGVEAGGAIKNIFAIAAGISDGLGLGDNTKAALVTRGLRELVSVGVAMGGKQMTFFGLTGLGDLVVTCFSRHSRNRAIGEKIGRGKSLSEAERELVMVAEGVKTTKSAFDLGKKFGLELPIIEQVYEVLYHKKSTKKAVQDLMMREAKPEMDFAG